MDQTIESTINKYRKCAGGISGRFSQQAIDNWANSFAFRALLSNNLHELCGIKTSHNSIDSHIECSPNRQAIDQEDLSIILKKLRYENLFTNTNLSCQKILSGLNIHDNIINSVTILHERGQAALCTYINERLIRRTVPIDSPLKTIHILSKKYKLKMKLYCLDIYGRLELKQADTYQPDSKSELGKRHISTETIKDYHHLVNVADEEIRRTITIAKQRSLKPLSQFFSFEFAPVALSLCSTDNIDLFNQQSKSAVIKFLNKIYPSSFSSRCPVPTHESAIIIDGRTLFETKPHPNVKTIRDYAI